MIGCLIADSVLFFVGRTYGSRVLNAIGKVSLFSFGDVRDMERRFKRRGAISIIGAKFIPAWTTIAPILGGALGVSWSRFLLLGGLGSALWAVVGVGAGMVFAEQLPLYLSHLQSLGRFVAAAAAITIIVTVYAWWRKRARAVRNFTDSRPSLPTHLSPSANTPKDRGPQPRGT
jgi:membrane protein DedA with SNARE-associated domain